MDLCICFFFFFTQKAASEMRISDWSSDVCSSDLAYHRHNIGFMAVDDIVHRHGLGPWKSRFRGHAAEGVLDGVKVLALKPATFMNRSGPAVGEAKIGRAPCRERVCQ